MYPILKNYAPVFAKHAFSQGGILQVRSRLHKWINDFLLQLAQDLRYKVHRRCSLADMLDFAGKIRDMASSRDTSSEQYVLQQ